MLRIPTTSKPASSSDSWVSLFTQVDTSRDIELFDPLHIADPQILRGLPAELQRQMAPNPHERKWYERAITQAQLKQSQRMEAYDIQRLDKYLARLQDAYEKDYADHPDATHQNILGDAWRKEQLIDIFARQIEKKHDIRGIHEDLVDEYKRLAVQKGYSLMEERRLEQLAMYLYGINHESRGILDATNVSIKEKLERIPPQPLSDAEIQMLKRALPVAVPATATLAEIQAYKNSRKYSPYQDILVEELENRHYLQLAQEVSAHKQAIQGTLHVQGRVEAGAIADDLKEFMARFKLEQLLLVTALKLYRAADDPVASPVTLDEIRRNLVLLPLHEAWQDPVIIDYINSHIDAGHPFVFQSADGSSYNIIEYDAVSRQRKINLQAFIEYAFAKYYQDNGLTGDDAMRPNFTPRRWITGKPRPRDDAELEKAEEALKHLRNDLAAASSRKYAAIRERMHYEPLRQELTAAAERVYRLGSQVNAVIADGKIIPGKYGEFTEFYRNTNPKYLDPNMPDQHRKTLRDRLTDAAGDIDNIAAFTKGIFNFYYQQVSKERQAVLQEYLRVLPHDASVRTDNDKQKRIYAAMLRWDQENWRLAGARAKQWIQRERQHEREQIQQTPAERFRKRTDAIEALDDYLKSGYRSVLDAGIAVASDPAQQGELAELRARYHYNDDEMLARLLVDDVTRTHLQRIYNQEDIQEIKELADQYLQNLNNNTKDPTLMQQARLLLQLGEAQKNLMRFAQQDPGFLSKREKASEKTIDVRDGDRFQHGKTPAPWWWTRRKGETYYANHATYTRSPDSANPQRVTEVLTLHNPPDEDTDKKYERLHHYYKVWAMRLGKDFTGPLGISSSRDLAAREAHVILAAIYKAYTGKNLQGFYFNSYPDKRKKEEALYSECLNKSLAEIERERLEFCKSFKSQAGKAIRQVRRLGMGAVIPGPLSPAESELDSRLAESIKQFSSVKNISR